LIRHLYSYNNHHRKIQEQVTKYLSSTLTPQRYQLGITTNGTTIAGGNGIGSGSDQLNQPYGVCVSSKTGDIYIADNQNHRIQRWSPGAITGVTIIGITGVNGISATMLYSPSSVALSKNETYLYVSDMDNHRVQRFNLT
jgi:DNA-binding beta-propeller fold protein YncE